ncbi:hypothetical protein EZV62_012006 [Acer yangbiense]|uniref:Flavin-containing monooxygenase n=1 Tax=Acer yangbiense TaxID=1000413 RepID=A0A5C7I8S0_9ROSI|nr:hypothetical protein EZV62_012006 [Acer yangbiense]
MVSSGGKYNLSDSNSSGGSLAKSRMVRGECSKVRFFGEILKVRIINSKDRGHFGPQRCNGPCDTRMESKVKWDKGLEANSENGEMRSPSSSDFGAKSNKPKALEVHKVDFVILCVGRFCDVPNIPKFPPKKGPEAFHGKVIHSMDYAAMDYESAANFVKGKLLLLTLQWSAQKLMFYTGLSNGMSWLTFPRDCLLTCLCLNRFSELLVHKPGEGFLLSLLATMLSPLVAFLSLLYFDHTTYTLIEMHSKRTNLLVPKKFHDKVEEGSIILKKSQSFSFCEEGILVDGEPTSTTPLKTDVVILATGFRGDQKLRDIFVSQVFQDYKQGSSDETFPLYSNKVLLEEGPEKEFLEGNQGLDLIVDLCEKVNGDSSRNVEGDILQQDEKSYNLEQESIGERKKQHLQEESEKCGSVGNSMEKKQIGIVGAGISGLIACKYMLSKDFPWPSSITEDFPTQHQVFDYIQSYAQHFDLLKYIRFNTKVVGIEYDQGLSDEELRSWSSWNGNGQPFHDDQRKWKVSIEDTLNNSIEVYTVDFVILCVGRFSDVPNIPEFPPKKGPEAFHGKLIHSMDYAAMDYESAANFVKGKLVGLQKSALDIAMECTAANNGLRNPCTVLYKNEHWNVPDYLPWGFPLAFLYLNRFSELLIHKPGEGFLLNLLATILSPLRWGFSKFVESDIKKKH